MTYGIPDELVQKANEWSVLDYFNAFMPGVLYDSGKVYRRRDHPSCCISKDGWAFDWKSQGFSGYGAIEYLKQCESMKYIDAVKLLTGVDVDMVRSMNPLEEKHFISIPFALPERNYTDKQAISYLYNRGISHEVIDYCINNYFLYQSKEYEGTVLIGYGDNNKPLYISRNTYKELMKQQDVDDVVSYCINNNLLLSATELSKLKQMSNVVFVGFDTKTNQPAYAAKRGMYNKVVEENGKLKNKSFRQEVSSSNKAYSFAMRDKTNRSNTVHIFEAAIDAMSYATLIQLYSSDFQSKNLLSLGGAQSGTSSKFKSDNEVTLPLALEEFIKTSPQEIKKVYIHFDNDEAGIKHSKVLQENLAKRGIESVVKLPPSGKDVNDFLKATLEELNRNRSISARDLLSRG